MSAAQILAAGGTCAATLAMLGGFLVCPALVGASGLVMLIANVLVLAGVGKRK